jgi:hypothetical protein
MKRFGVTMVLLGAGGLMASLAAGCGGIADAHVSGTVLMDSKPLEEGDIIFEEMDKSKTPAGGKIVDGKYTLKVQPGSKMVRITASRPTKKPDPVMGASARESMIAKEFNEKTTLKANIQPGQNEGVNFEVKSIP